MSLPVRCSEMGGSFEHAQWRKVISSNQPDEFTGPHQLDGGSFEHAQWRTASVIMDAPIEVFFEHI